MGDVPWREAIVAVLRESAEPMHYADIAEAVTTRGLRTEVGATPAATVAATISISRQNEGADSPFVRIARGIYGLAGSISGPVADPLPTQEEEIDDAGLINAFGMYWTRANVLWTTTPRILGRQQTGSTPVDFCQQRGVYLLHDGRAVVYVGRTTDQPLGVRLRQHIADRLNGRWDRFSWFGVFSVSETGSLDTGSGTYDLEMLIVTMEALLIEGLEPPQNRKRGDDFKAVEFLQVEDPDIQKTQILRLMDELKQKL